MQSLNCKGLACPSPVLRTKELIETHSPSEVRVLVDNEAASQNVVRFLQSQGFEALVESAEGEFVVTGTRNNGGSACVLMKDEDFDVRSHKTMIMIATDRMGFGDDTLGRKLMVSFLSTLREMDELWRLVFVNNGVKLTAEGVDTIQAIRELEQAGVSVLVCGTCLSHFDLLNKKQVGETTNMLDIITSMQVADKVINL